MKVHVIKGPVFKLVSIAIVFLSSCHSDDTLFKKVASNHSNIHFINSIHESDSVNLLDMGALYNGAGIACGDFNNDNLTDIYFTANASSNKLYLNRGGMSFSDITDEAKVDGSGRWSNGATIVDINNDGWQDIYVSTSIKPKSSERQNLLYVNKGLNAKGVPVFSEMAKEYGLADSSLSVHAAFFDYDNDGDLDMYLLTTNMIGRESTELGTKKSIDKSNVDKLYRNDFDKNKKHPYFTDVSDIAGIKLQGYGLGLAIADINRDGWKDILATNDFYTSDHLYINNKDGTFTDKARKYFKHESLNAMGTDVIDINNDGLSDVITLDMNPESNFRKKKNMNPGSYFAYQNMMAGYHSFQYMRNTLQLNMGPRITGNDSIGDPIFADIGFYAGVAETDWSWTPSVADFDNDGFRDIIITNGFPKDVTDHDFASYRSEAAPSVSKSELLRQIPEIKIANYGYKNDANLKFTDVTYKWGLEEPSFSTGAMYADLDNDGDLDYIINNTNHKAFLYENTASEKLKSNFLEVVLIGNSRNRNAIGAWVEIYYDQKMQAFENSPYRGYLSTCDSKIHFGLGTAVQVDSVVVRWPEGRRQIVTSVMANQILRINSKDAAYADNWALPVLNKNALFRDLTRSFDIDYKHHEADFIDFDYEKLLPRKFSESGPGLAVGDVDGNGLDDLFIGGSLGYLGTFLLQGSDGRFTTSNLPKLTSKKYRQPENMGVLLFDADLDGDLDLFCANGSNEVVRNSKNYEDHLYLNNGRGQFRLDTVALPSNLTSKSCVRAADFDRDGDLDLFVGGRVIPGEYPKPVNSFIYRNDSSPRRVKFTNVTHAVAPELINIGLTCDAIWSDFNNDGWTDLIIAAEYQPVIFLKNVRGKLRNIGTKTGVSNQRGWWNSLVGGDFDNDGDIDYVVGNHGENSYFRVSNKFPLRMYANDYDKNGRLDPIMTMYLKNDQGNRKEFVTHSRDEIVEQIPGLKKRFLTYESFGLAEFSDFFSKKELEGALTLEANNFSSSYIENRGSESFSIRPLPAVAQFAPLNGMVAEDVNDDGYLDLVIAGNDFGAEVSNGRQDAMNGLLLLGNGSGGFKPTSILQSGFFVPGNAKALVKLRGKNGKYLLAASQNKGDLKLFNLKSTPALIPLKATDRAAFLKLKKGTTRIQEVYHGNSYLSQSASFIKMGNSVKSIEIVQGNGVKRSVAN